MTMRGTSPIQGVQFGIRTDEVVTAAELSLSGALSPALLPEESNVTVTLNEQYLGTIPVNRDQPDFERLLLPVSPAFFQDLNRLNFRFAGRYTTECNDPLSPLLWATVSDVSVLNLTLDRLPARRDLARLPRPFFDSHDGQKLTLPFVLAPGGGGNDVLRAAAIAASWFGRLAEDRGAAFPVLTEPPAEGNGVVVVSGGQTPSWLPFLAPLAGPTIAVLANPRDPFGSLLVIAGRNGEETVAAAGTLALGAAALGGASAVVGAPAAAARLPYDAPAWIPTDRPVKLGELVDPAALQGTGYVPGTFHVPFRTAPDLITWRGLPFRADIRFRAPPAPIEDLAVSRLDLSLNGMFLRSYPLAGPEPPLAWLTAAAGLGTFTRRAETVIPPYMLYGQNDLQLYFDARPLRRGACVAIPEDLRMSVDPDSTIDLSRAWRFATLPDLGFFGSSGFPFTRLADLSETTVVLAERPGAAELGAFLGLMGRLGALTFYPVTGLQVTRPGDGPVPPGRDVLMLGTFGQMEGAADLLADSPFALRGGRLSVRLPDRPSLPWRGFANPVAEDRARAAAALSVPFEPGAAAMIGLPGPAGRSVVALLAASPPGLEALVAALGDPARLAELRGDLAILGGGRITAFRTGPTYTVGHLPFWLYLDWQLRDQPAAILGLMLLGTALVATFLNWAVRRRAGRRLGRVA